MSEPVSLTTARDLSGVRLGMLRGIPSPWGQAAKGILEIKKIPFVRAYADGQDQDGLLREWTGQDSYPVLAYDRERPRTGWAEILFLAERLAPTPALVPVEPTRRTLFFGLAHEICGEMGLGWCSRLLSLHRSLQRDPSNDFVAGMANKYGYAPAAVAAAPERSAAVLRQLDDCLAKSHATGGRYLLGEDLTALDIYWATFSNIIQPLPPEQCPMPDMFRRMLTTTDSMTLAALSPALLAHRDFVFATHLVLPMAL